MVATREDKAGRYIAERDHPPEPCEHCGMPYGGRGRVQRHHRDGNRLNNDRSNIQFLCVKAHKDAHQSLDGMVGGGPRPRVNEMRTAKAIVGTGYARALMGSGKSIDEVAAILRVHPASVWRWLRKYP